MLKPVIRDIMAIGTWQARTPEEYSFGSSCRQVLPFYTGEERKWLKLSLSAVNNSGRVERESGWSFFFLIKFIDNNSGRVDRESCGSRSAN